MTDQPDYSPEDLAAVKGQVQPPPVGTGPDATVLAGKAADAAPYETDVNALLAQMQAQMDAMAGQIKNLKASQVPAGEHHIVSTAASVRDLIAHHFEFHPKGAELTRLADDLTDAARNSVESGDTGAVRQVAGKLQRRLEFFHPGPGDHHYFRLAHLLVRDSIPDAADTITEAKPSDAPAIGSDRAPAKVLQGSVTG